MEDFTFNQSADRATMVLTNAKLPQRTYTFNYPTSAPYSDKITNITKSGTPTYQINFTWDGR
jgi:hypothetical protein